jgi:SPP1 family predicted phage head-tail adaptor
MSVSYTRAGDLDQPITIIQPPTTRSATGAAVFSDYSKWTVFGKLFAAFSPGGGMEARRAGQEVAESPGIFTIRYRAALPDTSMVIVHRGQYHEIKGVSPVDFARQAVEITCKQISSQQQ